jgi:rSAM/selenodomain-associated transferase 1
LNNPAIIIFGKSPRKDSVKTRLAHSLGDSFARAFYFECLKGLKKEMIKLPENIKKYLYAQSDIDFMQEFFGEDFIVREQVEGDLSSKIVAAIKEVFKASHSSVIILASDTPSLLSPVVIEAIKALENHDLAIGPSNDGGYYLLGQKKLSPSLFSDMPWSSDKVFKTTCFRARHLDLSYFEGQCLMDIDTKEDLDNWLGLKSSLRHPLRDWVLTNLH